jgi:hypothetical protein
MALQLQVDESVSPVALERSIPPITHWPNAAILHVDDSISVIYQLKVSHAIMVNLPDC